MPQPKKVQTVKQTPKPAATPERKPTNFQKIICGLRKERGEVSHSEPKSFGAHLEICVQNEVRRGFEQFMSDATPHELFMMREVLRERNNDVPLLVDGKAVEEVPLAAAIDSMLHRYEHTYIRVPDEALSPVRELVTIRQKMDEVEEQ